MHSQSPAPAGVKLDLDDLLTLRQHIGKRRPPSANYSANPLGGQYKSRLRGRGLDFAEVRPYQAGDDVRNIDWRVTARARKPHTRLYTEERERPVFILCDQRSTMYFGSQVRFKSVQAANLAALIAWQAQAAGDRIGALILGNQTLVDLPPKAASKHVANLLNDIARFNQQLNTDTSEQNLPLSQALGDARRSARPGSLIYILSDMSDLNSDAEEQIGLLARHCEVIGIRIQDPLEKTLPKGDGQFNVQQGEQSLSIDFASKTLRRNYAQSRMQISEQQDLLFLQSRAKLLDCTSDQCPITFWQQGGLR